MCTCCVLTKQGLKEPQAIQNNCSKIAVLVQIVQSFLLDFVFVVEGGEYAELKNMLPKNEKQNKIKLVLDGLYVH